MCGKVEYENRLAVYIFKSANQFSDLKCWTENYYLMSSMMAKIFFTPADQNIYSILIEWAIFLLLF
jgi:hypothetical protein